MPPPDITCIVTFHSEGLLALRTLRSLDHSKQQAQKRGIFTEILCVLDRATPETTDLFRSSKYRALFDRVVISDLGDAGMARNFGVQQCSSPFIYIMDGDDLVSSNWFSSAFQRIKELGNSHILHSEWILTFDRKRTIWKQWPQGSEECFLPNYLMHNYWSALCFGHRSVWENTPYVYADHHLGFGYEDMHWNCETVAKGYVHSIVPNTTHFVRLKKTGSRNLIHIEKKTILLPSQLFSRAVFLPLTQNHLSDFDRSDVASSARRESFLKLSNAGKNALHELSRLVFPGKGVAETFSTRLQRLFLSILRIFHHTVSRPIVNLLPSKWERFVRSSITKFLKRMPAPKTYDSIENGVVQQLREVAEFEPELFPTDEFVNSLALNPPLAKETLVVRYYFELLEKWGDRQPSTLVIIPPGLNASIVEPHIREAGRDTLFLSFDASFDASFGNATVIKMLWAEVFSERLQALLAKIILQLNPKTTMVFTAPFTIEFLNSYGLPASEFTQFHIVCPAIDSFDLNKRVLEMLFNRFKCFSTITVEDNQLRSTLENVFGLTVTKVTHFERSQLPRNLLGFDHLTSSFDI